VSTLNPVLISSARFAEHQTPPGHPERPERAQVMDAVASRWRATGGEVVAPREATHEQLARVHDVPYIHRISELRDRAMALDPDTYTSPETYEVALLAAGAAIEAVERAMSTTHTSTFALVRPPGHHAEHAHAMGFCLFNNVAVAAAHARHALGARRVAIVDYDVHHGNGTQHLFERDASVLYVSAHQYPYYPGTGAVEEIGVGPGEGFTVNLPMESGSTDADYEQVFDRVALPILRQFAPDLVLVSAGFDAHQRDPLATMRTTEAGFAAMTMALRRVADECCRGRIALVTEGGYDLAALEASIEAVVLTLAGPAALPRWPQAAAASSRGRVAADAAVTALSHYWKLQ
jgi:acetoin utilization deacetylase AcuC-like enzyme